jgi:hypothetical protein
MLRLSAVRDSWHAVRNRHGESDSRSPRTFQSPHVKKATYVRQCTRCKEPDDCSLIFCSKTRQQGKIRNISNPVSEAVDQQSQCNREIFRLPPETRLASVDIRFRNKDALSRTAFTPEQRTSNTDPQVPWFISAYAYVKIRITKSNTPEQRRQPYTRGHQDSWARIKTLKYVLVIP